MRKLVVKAGKHLLRALGDFQARHSLIATTPFINNSAFDWTGQLENDWRQVRDELEHVLEHPEDIPAFHQLSPDQARISKGDNWKTFPFWVFGKRLDDNCAVCPQTAALLDELPQLFNVIRNEMSLVGPRPALSSEMADWDPALYARLQVKPGITGMWQVSGRSGTTFAEYTRLDLYYVHNWSLLVDLSILAKTIPAVLKSDGAF